MSARARGTTVTNKATRTNHHHYCTTHVQARGVLPQDQLPYVTTMLASPVHVAGPRPRKLSERHLVAFQISIEVLHLLQGEETRDATLLKDVDNNEHRRLRREPYFQGLMNRRRLRIGKGKFRCRMDGFVI